MSSNQSTETIKSIETNDVIRIIHDNIKYDIKTNNYKNFVVDKLENNNLTTINFDSDKRK
jgi:hypothetical protein